MAAREVHQRLCEGSERTWKARQERARRDGRVGKGTVGDKERMGELAYGELEMASLQNQTWGTLEDGGLSW